MAAVISRAQAIDLDAADPLAPWRERFVTPDVHLPRRQLARHGAARRRAPGSTRCSTRSGPARSIGSWDHWLDLPARVGDRLAPVIGAAAGTVVVHDSTTVNLYQLVHAALGAVTHDRPTVIAVDAGDFPTDRYVVAGIAAATGATVRRGCDDLGGVDVAAAFARRLPHGGAGRPRRRDRPRRRARHHGRVGPVATPPARWRST